MTWAIESALRDPEGARKAVFALGAEMCWPACLIGGLNMEQGGNAWAEELNAAEGLQLGLAWESLCQLEDAARAQRGFETSQRKRPAAIAPAANKMANSQKDKTVTVIQATKYEGLEPGYYPARIAELVDEPAKPKTPGMLFEPRPQVRFQFQILDQQGRDLPNDIGGFVQMRGWCNASWGPKAKLFEWATAILKGKCPPSTEPIDTDVLLNRKVDICVEAEGDKSPRITRLHPYRSMSAVDEDDTMPAVKLEVPF